MYTRIHTERKEQPRLSHTFHLSLTHVDTHTQHLGALKHILHNGGIHSFLAAQRSDCFGAEGERASCLSALHPRLRGSEIIRRSGIEMATC